MKITIAQLKLKNISTDLLADYLWEKSCLDSPNNLSYDFFYTRKGEFQSLYHSWVDKIYPEVVECIEHHQDWDIDEALSSIFKCFNTYYYEDVHGDLMSLLAFINDVTKVKSKSYPKLRRDFYKLKSQIIGFLFRQNYQLGRMWWEEDENNKYLVLTFSNKKGNTEWVFHQPERYFREHRQKKLKTLPVKPYHRESQTSIPAQTLEEFTVGDYERVVAWLSILYHMFINIYNQNY